MTKSADSYKQTSSEGRGREEVKVIFFEDNTGTLTNGTIWIKFNYTFTEPLPEEINYTQEGLKFKNNGTVIIK